MVELQCVESPLEGKHNVVVLGREEEVADAPLVRGLAASLEVAGQETAMVVDKVYAAVWLLVMV